MKCRHRLGDRRQDLCNVSSGVTSALLMTELKWRDCFSSVSVHSVFSPRTQPLWPWENVCFARCQDPHQLSQAVTPCFLGLLSPRPLGVSLPDEFSKLPAWPMLIHTLQAHPTRTHTQLRSYTGFPGGNSGEEPACQHRRCRFDPLHGGSRPEALLPLETSRASRVGSAIPPGPRAALLVLGILALHRCASTPLGWKHHQKNHAFGV